MAICCAFRCSNRTENQKNITFHRFPKSSDVRKKWIVAVRRKNWNPSATTVLCSEHFEESSFDRSLKIVRLKKGAFPTIFPAHESYYQNKVARQKEEGRVPETIVNISSTIMHEDTPDNEQEISPAQHATSSDQDILSSREEISPLKCKLEDMSSKYEVSKKNVRRLQQKRRRLLKKESKLENIIENLKKQKLLKSFYK